MDRRRADRGRAAGLPRLGEIGVDSHVLLFALAVSVVSSVLFGVAPALQATRVDVNRSLRQGGRAGALAGGGSGSAAGWWWRRSRWRWRS